MSQYKISIILPVYNVEKYLRECMESLVHQSLQEIEIIAVNDGSPDHSIDILNEYEKKYPQILKVYSTENRGVSHARNFGIDKAKGEYILFVDSDDYIELDMCEQLYQKAVQDDNDVVICGRYNINLNKNEVIKKDPFLNLPMDQNFKLSDRKYELIKISPFPWDKLFKKSLIGSLRFEENSRFEDLLFTYCLLPSAKNIGIVNKPLYNYRRTNTGGFLNSFTEATLDIVSVFEKLVNYYKSTEIICEFYEELEYLCLRHFYYRYKNFFVDDKENGELQAKIRLIEKSSAFLFQQFPNWKNNHYLKYSSPTELKTNYDLYFNPKKMMFYVKAKDYLPEYLMNFFTYMQNIPQRITDIHKTIKRKSLKKIVERKYKKTKLYKLLHLPASYQYSYYYEKMAVMPSFILFESKHGEDLAGNIFRMILSTARSSYEKYKIGLVVKANNREKINNILEQYHISHVTYIELNSKEYYKALASAKYLITDTSFPPYYIKKEEQVYLNTWHGTPLKQMGRVVPQREYGLGNVQRNFFIADYLLYQQDFSKEVFFRDYMLENLFHGTVLLSGYPRNSAFYLTERYDEIRKELDLSKKQVIVYMPTWRGTLNKKENAKQISEITEYLSYIDTGLTDDQIFYVKLHTFVHSALDYSEFYHIKPFPEEYETYDFLNASDVLVTDYSSIMFDYACSKKKIILFTYDREEYLAERGIYLELDSLGLPFCNTVYELLEELKNPIMEYNGFYQRFCCYDSLSTVDDVLDVIVQNKNRDIATVSYKQKNKKKNLVYVNDFKTGMGADTIISALNAIQSEISYFVCFKSSKLKKNSHILAQLDKKVGYIPFDNQIDMCLWEKMLHYLSCRFGFVHSISRDKLERFAQREARRRFGENTFENIIIHSCMDKAIIKTLSNMQANKKIYCFSLFSEKKYRHSKKYKKSIHNMLKNLTKMDVIYAPTVMQSVIEQSQIQKTSEIVYFDIEMFHFSSLIEEVEQ